VRCGESGGGEILQSRVKDHVKLFGPDVIAVHRLLKNDVPADEYVLFTQALASGWPSAAAPSWSACEEHSGELRRWPAGLPVRAARGVAGGDTRAAARGSQHRGHDRTRILNRADDRRAAGARFRCHDRPAAPSQMDAGCEGSEHVLAGAEPRRHEAPLPDRPQQPDHGDQRKHESGDAITLTETDERQMMCSVYTLHREGETRTHVRFDGFVKAALGPRLLVGLLLRKKLPTLFATSCQNLKRYCEQVYARNRESVTEAAPD
jgi:Protein of unknown function (DUF2652)